MATRKRVDEGKLARLKKSHGRPSKKSDRPKSNADSNATQKRLAGSRWNLAGASGLNCVSRVSKGRRVLYPALNNRTWSIQVRHEHKRVLKARERVVNGAWLCSAS